MLSILIPDSQNPKISKCRFRKSENFKMSIHKIRNTDCRSATYALYLHCWPYALYLTLHFKSYASILLQVALCCNNSFYGTMVSNRSSYCNTEESLWAETVVSPYVARVYDDFWRGQILFWYKRCFALKAKMYIWANLKQYRGYCYKSLCSKDLQLTWQINCKSLCSKDL